jgi:hypothetical protein
MAEREEISELHTSSRIPEKIFERELEPIWRTEYPNRPVGEFYRDPAWKEWRSDTQARLEDFSNRWQVERPKLGRLELVDEKIGTSLKPVNDHEANQTYIRLLGRFEDAIGPHGSKWPLPSDAWADFTLLQNKTNEQVQRNASSLAAVVETTRILAGDEVERKAKSDAVASNPNIDVRDLDAKAAKAKQDWEDSTLYSTLDELEQRLTEWDKLLAERPLPEAEKLKKLAEQCDDLFTTFELEHPHVFAADGTVPFVRYQLLATMRSVSEKIASQFAARLRNPSFSAAYGLITEVPVSGMYNAIQAKANALQRSYGAAPEKGFKKERDSFTQKIKDKDKKVAYPALMAELAKMDGLDSSLKKWRDAYSDIGGGTKGALSSLYESTAELAFQLKNCKKAIDRVLADNPSKAVQAARKSYQETLDGFIVNITGGILIGEKLLS